MEIRNSTPDMYRELQLPQGKKESRLLPPSPSAAVGHPTAAVDMGRDPRQRQQGPSSRSSVVQDGRKTDSPESSKTHSDNYFMGLFFSDAPSFGLKNLRVLEESKFPVAPLGGEEMLSLLLKDHGVKWAAPAAAFPSRRLL